LDWQRDKFLALLIAFTLVLLFEVSLKIVPQFGLPLLEVVRIALILPLLIVGLAARLVDHEVALALASVHVVGLLLAPLMLATFLVTIAVFFLDALAAVVTPRTLAALLKLFLKLSFILLVVELAVIRLLIRVLFFH
jgi:hypothetical protein